jgi:dihydroorotase
MDQRRSNFLLKGGRFLDPAIGRDGAFDVRVHDGVVAEIGANLNPDNATVIDVKGLLVTPGLIDVHLHLMKGLGAFGVDPDIFGGRLRGDDGSGCRQRGA